MGMKRFFEEGYDPKPCTNCGKVKVRGQWWILQDYFGINGYFCPHCFERVSHDSYKKPVHPKQYNAIAVRQQLEKVNRNANPN